MDHTAQVEANEPISSGVTEAACKVIVKQRLCGSGRPCPSDYRTCIASNSSTWDVIASPLLHGPAHATWREPHGFPVVRGVRTPANGCVLTTLQTASWIARASFSSILRSFAGSRFS